MSAAPSAPALAATPVLGHRFADELPELALPWQAEAAPDPGLLVLDEQVAGDLGLDPEWLRSPDGVRFLVGAHVAEGSLPVAQAYAGHQFGSWNPRLGDGRALLLGEVTAADGSLRDLHLKGSGRTPFARAGDGLAAVGPMLREHVVSSALHALGVPTTRALAVVATGRPVQREELLPGAVLARTASSHLRVGSFQHARSLGDLGLLRRLADHAVRRHQPDAAALEGPERYRALLDGVVARQADLVARWMLVGFVHGVMNTDNMTVSGETIDLGPCAFVDAHDPAASFSSIDTAGRYAYGQQPGIAEWDLARLAEAVLPLLVAGSQDGQDDGADPLAAPGAADRAVALATESLGGFRTRFAAAWSGGMRRKLGLAERTGRGGDDADVDGLLRLLRADRVDHTSAFRRLAGHARGLRDGRGSARELFPDPSTPDGFDAWAERWLALGPDPDLMDRANPLYTPRNHLVEEALGAATDGDLAPLERLVDVVTHPFVERPGAERYAEPAPEGFGAYTTTCGT